MRAHLCSNGHLLTPALKEIWQTRARVLQWHTKNGHKNILFTDEKIFTIEEQYNNHNKIYAQTSLEVCSEGARRPSPFLHHGLVGGVPWGVTHLHFCKKGVQLVSECIKELWNILTWPLSVVRNGSSSRTQFLPKWLRWLRSGCGGTFWPSTVPRIGFWGMKTSKPWTMNCGLFWRTWGAKSATTAWRAWGDPL